MTEKDFEHETDKAYAEYRRLQDIADVAWDKYIDIVNKFSQEYREKP